MKFQEGAGVEYAEAKQDQTGMIYLIVYYKDNCPACHDAIPRIEHYLEDQGYSKNQMTLFRIHTNTLTMDQIQERNLRAAPTLHIFQNGEFLGGIQGGLGTTPYSYLDSELGKILKGRT